MPPFPDHESRTNAKANKAAAANQDDNQPRRLHLQPAAREAVDARHRHVVSLALRQGPLRQRDPGRLGALNHLHDDKTEDDDNKTKDGGIMLLEVYLAVLGLVSIICIYMHIQRM